ncbi:hypothetical protein [Pseudomonas sp. K2I15]|uniref:hypothetical protein n=1 Tax=unclassified Pseudomonas TaxID=196821 RepID=UPI000B4CC179|nr:hypothetical protein [Pseudomonas sp. K2I15]OWP70603.1 hypothetical protein CEC48_16795 [Pseudomonas sp. K2I15]
MTYWLVSWQFMATVSFSAKPAGLIWMLPGRGWMDCTENELVGSGQKNGIAILAATLVSASLPYANT